MKTIEQKAKAYDEIIERAKTMLAAGEVMYGKENNASQLITDLIPELRESEDEKIIEEIRFAVMQMPSERQDTKNRCFAWLEKQKEQKVSHLHPEDYPMAPGECIKSVWSEEDEKKIHFLSRLIDFQVNDGEYCFGGNHRMVSKQEAIEMLLSLRPHPHWKPSEEQITILWDAICNLKHDGYKHTEELISLYEELKKL